jgi:hypothetical protein
MTDWPVSLEYRSEGNVMTLKDKIVLESLRQFSTKGLLATSTKNIIQNAGTSNRTNSNEISI